jgi:RNA polymerase Rpb4
LELTKSELLQLLNTKPTTTVELHCIVESAATRMSDAEQADLLELISSAC